MAKKSFKTLGSDEKTITDLTRAYNEYIKKLLKEKKIPEQDALSFLAQADKGTLSFQTPEEATSFFTERAKAGDKFMAFLKEGDGLTGDYKFSDGDGTLYEGKVKPETAAELAKNWKEIKNNPAIISALKDNDEEKLKTALDQIRHATPVKAAQAGLTPLADSATGANPDEEAADSPSMPHH